MAYVNPCNLSSTPSNTGSECSAAMKATAMIILVPRLATWTQAQIDASPYNGSVTDFVIAKAHAAAATRWFPIFGSNTPITAITDSNEGDVIETQDDGSASFIRYGKINRTFVTTAGGLCLAEHLMSIRGSSYSFIEVDIDGQVAWKVNADGSFSGFPTTLAYAPAPMLANLKTTYKNQFMLSYDPSVYARTGKIISPDTTEDLLSQQGLIDAEVTVGTSTQTTTNIFIGVKTVCAETDLVALYTGTGAGTIGQISNFIVTSAAGAVITPSAVAIVSGQVRLTGVYTTGTNITVALAAPSVLLANGITGYEGTVVATVPIP